MQVFPAAVLPKENRTPKMGLQAELRPRRVRQDYHRLEAEAGYPPCFQRWREEENVEEALNQLPRGDAHTPVHPAACPFHRRPAFSRLPTSL